MHMIDDGLQDVWVAELADAMAEVKDMSGMAPTLLGGVVGEHTFGSGDRHVRSSENQCRVEVALDDEVSTEATAGFADRCSPVEAEDPWASAGHRLVHRIEEMIAPDSEVHAWSVGVTRTEFGEYSGGVR